MKDSSLVCDGESSRRAIFTTRGRTVRAVALGIAVLTATGPGCSSSSDDSPPPNVLGAPLESTKDASSTDGAAGPDDPPEELCELTGPPASTAGDALVFADEFSGTSIDTRKWNVANSDLSHGAVLNWSSPAHAQVHDGSLFILSDRSPTTFGKDYASGFIDTAGNYARTYGKIEFRARFPHAAGVWYALWGTPWSQPFPEIDIELTNIGPSQLWFVNHWAGPPLPAAQRRSYVTVPKDLAHPVENIDFNEFHTYSVLWKPGVLEWSIDGQAKMQATPQGVPNLPVFWKINAWVGGWGGAPTEATQFPVTFEVDYFRIYRVDGLIADPLVKIMNKKSVYAKADRVQLAVANFDEACAQLSIYDGPTLIKTTSTRPFSVSLSQLKAGQHSLSFVATDGVRSAIASLETTTE